METMTGQISRDRSYRLNEAGLILMDTSVRSAPPIYSIFAPTWDMVRGVKDGVLPYTDVTYTEADYTRDYRRMMVASWNQKRRQWKEIMERKCVYVISCYCTPGHFCHRHLLNDIFKEISLKYNLPYHYYGEFE